MAKTPLLNLGMIAPELCRSNKREDEEGHALFHRHGTDHISCPCAFKLKEPLWCCHIIPAGCSAAGLMFWRRLAQDQ